MELRPRGRSIQRSVVIASVLAFVAALAATAIVLTSVLSSGDAEPRDDPSAFVSRIVGLIVADDYATAWTSLNPAHQRVATRREYVQCELQNPVASKLDSIEVLKVVDRVLRIPGASEKVSAKAVTLRIAIESGAGTSNSFKHTFNAVPNGSHWSWVLTPSRYQLYRDDACGVT